LDIFYLHFKCYPFCQSTPHPELPILSPQPLPPWRCSPSHPPTPSYLPTLAFPYIGAMSLHRTKGFSSHCCQTNAILCYICSWSHGSLHVYSWGGGLVPGSSRGGLVFDVSNKSKLTQQRILRKTKMGKDDLTRSNMICVGETLTMTDQIISLTTWPSSPWNQYTSPHQ